MQIKFSPHHLNTIRRRENNKEQVGREKGMACILINYSELDSFNFGKEEKEPTKNRYLLSC